MSKLPASDKPERDLPPIQPFSDLMFDPTIKLPPDIISGMVHEGAKLAIAGASKSYKSWALLNLAVSLGLDGAEWFGKACRPSKTLYLNFEIPPAFFRQRIDLVCKARAVPVPGNVDVWNLRGFPTGHDVFADRLVERLKREVDDFGSQPYKVVILDPMYKFYSDNTDENSAGGVASVMRRVDEVCVDAGVCLAFAAHFAKGNAAARDVIDRVSGSGVFGRDPDAFLTLIPHRQADCFILESRLRSYPPMQPSVVQWVAPLFIPRPDLSTKSGKGVSSDRDDAPKSDRANDLLQILKAASPPGFPTRQAFVAAAANHLELSEARIQQLIPGLRETSGVVVTDNRWVYTPNPES